MKKLLLLILVTLGYANYTAAIAGRYNPPPATFATGITGPVASGATYNSSPIPVTITLSRTAVTPLTTSSFTFVNTSSVTNFTEKVVLTYASQFGTAGTGNTQFNTPNDITVDAAGNTYVTDGANNRVEIFNSAGGYVTQFGSAGTGDGQFNNPYGIAVDGAGNIYVADGTTNGRVQEFNSAGGFLKNIGVGLLSSPQGLFIDGSGNLYVADSGNNRVAVFDNAGTYNHQVGSEGSGPGQFYGPSGVVVDANGFIYVTDPANNRVVKFKSTGEAAGTMGSFGTGNGLLRSPAGITTDGTNKLYVVDNSNQRIEIFSTSGTFLGTAGSAGNTGNGNFNFPTGITADKNGNIFVVDRNNNRIQRFTAKEQYTANLVPTANGTVSISLAGAKTTDINGEENDAATYSVNYVATPSRPAGLVGTSLVAKIELDWTANNAADNVFNYNIYEGLSPNSLSAIASVSANTTTYRSSLPLTNGTTYYYYITAVTAGGVESLPSDTVAIIPKANQTITVTGTIPNKSYGDAPFTLASVPLTAVASSGLPVSYSITTGNNSVATISGTTITITGVGHAVLAINQVGSNSYNPAPEVDVPFDVIKSNQTITIAGTIPDKTFGDAPFDFSAIPVTATASSGLPVAYAILSGPATLTGSTITITGTGTVTLAFNQAGDANYNPAAQKTLSFNVNKSDQIITIAGTIPNKMVNDVPFDISAIPVTANASSNLPVAITILSGPATISGTTITLTGTPGDVVVAFNQSGDTNYNAAPQKTLTFSVSKFDQTITIAGTIPDKKFDDAPFDISTIPVTATASSGLTVAYSILSGPATITGTTITITGVGAVTVAFNQAGNATYNAAPQQTLSFNVGKANQTITVAGTIPNKNFGDAPFDISAIPVTGTASSNLPVAVTIKSGPATISGNTITLTGAGTVVVAFNQAGNNDYNAAPEQTLSFTVGKQNQTITVAGTIPSKNFGDAPFDISAIPVTGTASSNLPVAITIKSGPATISGNTITLTGAGTVVVAFNQAGNTDYNAAPEKTLNFTVGKKDQTITIAGTIPDKNFGDAAFNISSIPVTATASSGLAVAYSILSGPATISGTTITLTGSGTVTVAFNQAGNTDYNAAPQKTLSFNVGKSNQTITVAGTIPNKSYGDPAFDISAIPVTATASSGLPVAYSILSGPATISGTSVTVTGIGTVTVAFNQAGNTDYNPAPQQTLSFNVGKANQTITVAGTIPAKNFGDAPFDISTIPVTGTASSGLSVAITIKSGPATIAGNTITLTGAGTVVVAFNQAGNTNYNAAPEQTLSFTVGKQNQTITVAGTIPSKNFGDAPFDISAIPVTGTASSNLPVAVTIKSGPATISGNTITLTGAGTVVVAFNQAGNTDYNAAPEQTLSFNVGKKDQTIAIADTIPDKNFGDAAFNLSSIPVTATASSGLTVAYSILSGPATISGTTITLTGSGTVVVAFNQAGNTNYNAAPQKTLSFNVGKSNQTITVAGTIPNKSYGDPAFDISAIPVTATASSGLAVAYSILSGPATISGTSITVTGIGTVTVAFNQAGNTDYNPAPQKTLSFNVGKANQTITVAGTIPSKNFGDAPFDISAIPVTGTASSGLQVAVTIKSGPATISGSTITLTGAGTVVVAFNQAGNANYNAAPEQTLSFTVGKQNQTITVAGTIPSKNFGDAPFDISAIPVTGTASSGLPVAITIKSGPATISGNTITLTGAGTVVVAFNQAGNTDYNAAPEKTLNFTVGKKDQTITVAGTIPDKNFGDAPFNISSIPVTATASSGLAVAYSILSGPATIAGTTITLTGSGTVVVAFNQAGNTDYNVAPQKTLSFNVGKSNQTITIVTTIPDKNFNDPAFDVSGVATASSGLPVAYSILSGPATISGTMISVTGIGTVTVALNQSGNTDYNAAPQKTTTFNVGKANQTITVAGTISSKNFGDAPFDISAIPVTGTASSGLSVAITIKSGPATIAGNTITLTGAGTVVVAFNQAGNTDYNAAPEQTLSFTVGKQNQTITVAGTIPSKNFGDAPFNISAIPVTGTASSGLSVAVTIKSGPATISGNTITLTGAGTVVVAFNQPGNTDYNAAPEKTLNFTVGKKDQAITLAGTIPDKNNGDAPFDISAIPVTATASSGLPVAYSILSGPATISGTTISITGMGTVTVAFNQAGNTDYNAAPQQTLSFNVGKANQTITVAGTIPNKNFGDAAFDISTIPVTATASSGLGVSYSILSGPATIAGTTISLTGVGTVTVAFNQAGNAAYNAAPQQTLSFTVGKANQTITVAGTIPAKNFGDAPFDISAIPVTGTASSGLQVAITIKSGPATISGNTISITGAGTVVVAFNQAGNTDYNAAPEKTLSFTVGKLNQTITVAGTIPDKNFGDAPFDISAIPVTGTASSGLQVAISIKSGPATIAGNTITLTGAGIVVVAFNQAGNGNYNAAAEHTLTFNVAKHSQTITVAGTIPDKNFGDAPFSLSAIPVTSTASSGLPVAVTIKSGPATLTGNTITLTGGGTVVVAFNQAGNTDYSAAQEQTLTFTVNKINQTITVAGTIPDKSYGDAPFDISAIPVTANASSGLQVAYSILSGPASISGTTITLTGMGTVVVAFNQAGNSNYNAAPQQTLSFNINKADQSITIAGTIPDKTINDVPFDISSIPVTATASSGLAVSYSILSGPASISGTTITLTGASGTVVVAFNQVGDTHYNAAPQKTLSFNVSKVDQTITVAGTIPAKNFGDAPFDISAIPVTATASSGLAVSYSILSGPATITGTTISVTGTGAVTVAFNQPGDAHYNAAPQKTLSFNVNKLSQTITVAGSIPAKNFGDAPFDISAIPVTATASSGLTVAITIKSGPATITGNTITLTGAGTVVVAFNQAGNTNYSAATEQTLNFTVGRKDQTITVAGIIPDKNFGDASFDISAIPVTATATSGLPVAYSILSGPATISGTTISLTGSGTVVVAFNQTGNTNYNAAPQQTLSFSVGKHSQTITVAGTIPNKNFGDAAFDISAIPVTATASSGLAVAYSILSGPATINGTTIALTGSGTVVVAFNQSGNTDYSAASQQTLSFNVGKNSQTITVAGTIPAKNVRDAAFDISAIPVSATASSGLSVVYSILSGPATISGTTITVTAAGTVVVAFNQPGDANYNAAPQKTLSFSVNKNNQTITVAGTIPSKTFGDAQFDISGIPVTATASSGLPVAYSILSGPATISGTTIALTGSGTVVVAFNQAGNDTYDAATQQILSFSVGKASQTIAVIGTIPAKNFGDAPFDISAIPVTAVASSGLLVATTISGPATLSGSTISLTGAGTVTVTFSQAGNANYSAAVPQTLTFSVGAITPHIAWTNPTDITYGTSLSTVQYNAAATIPGTSTAIAGHFDYSILPLGTTEPLPVGSYTLKAVFHPSNPTNYVDNVPAMVTINVGQATPVITWNPLPMTVGAALGVDQLNANTTTTTGHFDYTPTFGTIINTTGNLTLTTVFTPTDAVNYKSVTVTKQINVSSASVAAINPQINWDAPAPITYGTILSSIQLNATATLPNTTTTVAGTFSYTPDATNGVLPVGTYTIRADFKPTNISLYNPVSKTVSITVTPVRPVITWNKPGAVVVGTALTNTQLDAQTTINGTFVYTPAAGVVMNTVGNNQPLSVVFHPADTHNYVDVTANTTINVYSVDISKITPVINWNTPADISYGTLINSTQLNATTADASIQGTFAYSPDGTSTVPLAVGNYTLSVTFTPTDQEHYNIATQSVVIHINPVQPVISWAAPAPITYGTALSTTQLNATANIDGTFVYSPNVGEVLNVGAQTLLATFTPRNNNYQVTGKTVSITVNKATPVINWATPSNIAQGVALSTTQLNATTSVPGTFVYTPAIGDVLNAGTNQTLSVTFTPTDANNYNQVTKTVQINVGKLTPVLTWTNPTAITYGTALSDQQLYASSIIPGTFTYSPAAGTVLHAGNNQVLSVTFTPTDGINYNPVTKNVSINVSRVALNVSTTDVSRPYNQPNPDFVINYSGFVNGDTQANLTTPATASTTATTASLVGTYPITVIGAVSNDYTFRYVNASLTVTTIGRNLTFNQLPVKTYGDPDFDAGATATSGEPIIYTSSNTAVATIVNGQIHIVGAGYVTITASLPVNPDYNTTPSISQFMIVNKAAQTIDFANIPVQLRGTTYDLSNIKSSSGLPVTFTTNDPMIASINGLTVSSLRVGITGIVANQAGDANYYPANTVVRNLEVKDVNREVIVHPAVSPNGDGINDVLYIEGINEHPANRVTIINRNGVRVYEINGYDNTNKAFDGRSNFTGAKQQAGTYFYLVEYVVDGVGRHLTGYFVLKYD